MKTRIPIILLFIFASHFSFAQIQHFTNIKDGDIDGDGVLDFSIDLENSWVPTGDSRFKYYEGFIYPKNGLEIGSKTYYFRDSIDDKGNWSTIWKQQMYGYDQYYGYPELWFTKGFDFIEIRMKEEDAYYYGWIRRYGNINTRIVEGAIQQTPNIPILAGEGISSIKPLNPYCTDVHNIGNFSDIEVGFYSPFYSSFVKEYRIFVFKNGKEESCSSESLMSLPENKYTIVNSGKSHYEVSLSAEMLDMDGDLMNIKNEYKIVVLTVSNDTSIFQHDLNITVSLPINTSLPKAGKPVAIDKSDFGSSNDLQVTFVKNMREDMMNEYRLFVVPNDSVITFTKEVAETIENFHVINSNSDSVYIVQNELLKDIYGNSVQNNKLYKSFILSVPDSINANVGSLSEGSNSFCLGTPNYLYAGQKEGKEVYYHDFNPNIKADSLYFDFDNDGISDLLFLFSYSGMVSWKSYNYIVETINETEIVFTKEGIATNLKRDEPINTYRNWGKGKYTLAYTYNSGWSDGTRKGEFFYKGILAFRKNLPNDTIYGWLNLYNFFAVEIYDYVIQYNSMRFYPDSIPSAFLAYPNPNKNRVLNIAIEDFKDEEDCFIDVLNSSAIKMKSLKLSKKLSKINLVGLPRGIYYVRFRSPNKMETQKIMLL